MSGTSGPREHQQTPSPPGWPTAPRLAPATLTAAVGVFLAALIVYLFTLAPSVGLIDAGELTAAVRYLEQALELYPELDSAKAELELARAGGATR